MWHLLSPPPAQLEKQMDKKPLDSSYNRYCGNCKRIPVHHTSTLLLCSDCYSALRDDGTLEDALHKYVCEPVDAGEPVTVSISPIECNRIVDTVNEITEFDCGVINKKLLDKIQFSSGAVRGSGSLPFHLITPHGLLALAATFGEGAEKYTAYNNLKGFPLSNLFDHAMLHLLQFWWGDTSEDHLSHALWNIHQMLMQQSAADGKYEKLDDRPGVGLLTLDEVESYKHLMNSVISKLKEGR